jgi:hypothetical protein
MVGWNELPLRAMLLILIWIFSGSVLVTSCEVTSRVEALMSCWALFGIATNMIGSTMTRIMAARTSKSLFVSRSRFNLQSYRD